MGKHEYEVIDMPSAGRDLDTTGVKEGFELDTRAKVRAAFGEFRQGPVLNRREEELLLFRHNIKTNNPQSVVEAANIVAESLEGDLDALYKAVDFLLFFAITRLDASENWVASGLGKLQSAIAARLLVAVDLEDDAFLGLFNYVAAPRSPRLIDLDSEDREKFVCETLKSIVDSANQLESSD